MPKKRNFLGGMQNYNPKNGEYESRLTKADGTPATKENMPGGEGNKKSFKSFSKKGNKKPIDYEGVEETPYGYIYNVGNTSITDVKAANKSMGMDVDENKEYGYTVFKDGEEVYYSTFEEAYNSAKGNDLSVDDDNTFEKINNARMGTTTKEQSLSKTIKSQLKEAGIDTKKLSVRHRNAGYSDAIDIEIKDPNIDIKKVREIAEKHESYDRDIATGEILSGGNTYVHVQYDYGLFDKIGEEGKDNALSLMKQADNSQGNGIEIDDHIYLFKDGNKYFLSATTQGIDKIGRGSRDIYSPEDLAIKIWKLKKFGHIAR